MYDDKFLDLAFTLCTCIQCVMGTMLMLYTGKMCLRNCVIYTLQVMNYSIYLVGEAGTVLTSYILNK